MINPILRSAHRSNFQGHPLLGGKVCGGGPGMVPGGGLQGPRLAPFGRPVGLQVEGGPPGHVAMVPLGGPGGPGPIAGPAMNGLSRQAQEWPPVGQNGSTGETAPLDPFQLDHQHSADRPTNPIEPQHCST